MSEILSAAELHEKTIEWGEERKVRDSAKANEIFSDFYEDYILPEAEYGHHKVEVRNYQKELGLDDAGLASAFFECLDTLGYRWNAENVRTSDTDFVFENKLTVCW